MFAIVLMAITIIWRPGFTTAVCESWNVSDKYTWDNAGDLKQLSMDQTLSEDKIGAIKRQYFFTW